jgi:cold shock CspA family protein
MRKVTVKWFNVTKDFILIEEKNSKELFVQGSSIKGKSNKRHTKGDRVSFNDKIGFNAVDVFKDKK